MTFTQHYDSPLGGILLAADETGLTGLWFDGQKYFARDLPIQHTEQDTPVLSEARRWLDMYFTGREPDFLPPLHPTGSAFRRRVWDLRNYLYADRDRYPRSAMRLMFTSNHDENSWNGSEFRRLGDAAGIMAALTFVLPQSMPLVYTGQEFGYDHSFAFFDRDPMVDPRPGRFTELYRLLCLLKHRNRALQAGERGGSFVEIENNAKDCLMTFVREVEGNRVLCVMNLSPYAIHADFNTGVYQGEYADALTGNRIVVPYRVEQDMAPWSYRILIRE